MESGKWKAENIFEKRRSKVKKKLGLKFSFFLAKFDHKKFFHLPSNFVILFREKIPAILMFFL